MMAEQAVTPKNFRSFAGALQANQENFPDFFQKVREDAAVHLRTAGFPDRKHEAWRYVTLSPYSDQSWKPASPNPKLLLHSGILAPSEAIRLDITNGVPFFDLKNRQMDGLKVLPLSVALHQNLDNLQQRNWHEQLEEWSAFGWFNTLGFKEGMFIGTAKGMELREPVYLRIQGESALETAEYSLPRIFLSLAPGSKLTIILDLDILGPGRHWMNAILEADLGTGAQLEIIQSSRLGTGTVFLEKRLQLEQAAQVQFVSLTDSGEVFRDQSVYHLNGVGASVDYRSLNLLSGSSRKYEHVTAFHAVPGCLSRQTMKTLLSGKSQSEMNSLVHADRGAQKTDSNQLIRNILLSREAQAYARPQLKIYADDVKCSHGAATGQLEDTELFYLQSRGLDRATARNLILRGFAEDLIAGISSPKIHTHFQNRIAESLRLMA